MTKNELYHLPVIYDTHTIQLDVWFINASAGIDMAKRSSKDSPRAFGAALAAQSISEIGEAFGWDENWAEGIVEKYDLATKSLE